jgi:uncharacterized protein (DUF1697 family)
MESRMRYIAFLRAINVGGHVVKMEVLRRLFQELGLINVETFIASGNVIFESKSSSGAALRKKIEAHLQKALGYEVKTFIRSESEVAAIVGYKPFTAARIASATTFCVGFLAEPMTPDGVKALMALKTPDDEFHVNGREVYWLSKKGQGESTFSNALLEKTLKTRSTLRGVNTVVRLAAKHGCRP